MSAVLVHDHKFRRINGIFYSPGGLSNDVLTRYTDIFGKVTVIGRIIEENQIKGNYSEIYNPSIVITSNETMLDSIKSADAVIIRLPSLNGYKAIYLAKKYKKPYLVEVVGCTWDAYVNYGIKGKLAALPAYLIMRQCVRNAPFAVYVTKEFLEKRYPCKGECAAISDVALQKVDEDVLEKRLSKIGENRKTIIIGTAAAIDVPYKGQEYVIKAISELKNKTALHIEYQLAGTGNPDRLLGIAKTYGVEENIIIKGTIPHSDIFEWLDGLDIYIQPSMLEGLSRALVEAMSYGLPCIATDCGGNPELITQDFLVDRKNKSQIAHGISECLQNLLDKEICAEQIKYNFYTANTYYKDAYLSELRTNFYNEYKQELQQKLQEPTL